MRRSNGVFFCGDAPGLPISTNDVFLLSNRKHRLTRTQSAFSPVVFSPLFTGKDLKDLQCGVSFCYEKSSVCLTIDAECCLHVQTGISLKSPSVLLGLKP